MEFIAKYMTLISKTHTDLHVVIHDEQHYIHYTFLGFYFIRNKLDSEQNVYNFVERACGSWELLFEVGCAVVGSSGLMGKPKA